MKARTHQKNKSRLKCRQLQPKLCAAFGAVFAAALAVVRMGDGVDEAQAKAHAGGGGTRGAATLVALPDGGQITLAEAWAGIADENADGRDAGLEHETHGAATRRVGEGIIEQVSDGLSDALAIEFGGDGRLGYSPFCFPITSAGVRCVVVDIRLKELEPMAYKFLLNFAKDNDLRTRPGRIRERDDDAPE